MPVHLCNGCKVVVVMFHDAGYFYLRDSESKLLLACLMGQYCFTRWRLSSSVITLPAGGPGDRTRGRSATARPGAWAIRWPTLHGGPVRLRPVRATLCLVWCVTLMLLWSVTGHDNVIGTVILWLAVCLTFYLADVSSTDILRLLTFSNVCSFIHCSDSQLM